MSKIYRSHNEATRAQAQVARPDVSAWVSANAGSGKTRVLTNRVARLLLAGARPAKILCLTYTKAAAAEMQNRLFDKLGAWSMMEDAALSGELDGILCEEEPMADLPRARRLFAEALETPGGLKIQTIHAFCESLLARFPLEAGVSPHFSVVDEATTTELLQEAQDRVILARGEDPELDAALRFLLETCTEYGLDELLAAAVSHRAAFLNAQEPVNAALADCLGVDAGANPAALLSAWAEALDLRQIEQIGRALAGLSGKKDLEKGARMLAAIQAPGARQMHEHLRAALLTKEGAPPKSGFPSRAMEDAHPWALEPIAALQAGLMDLSERLRAAERLVASTHLARFARAVLTGYQGLKAQRAGLDYDDLIERAVGLLQRSDARDWVRFKLDGGIEHILVDEAQDTSPLQWAAIGALAEEFFAGQGVERSGPQEAEPQPRTVFAVGDEKQSIYSFQGAAPEQLDQFGALFQERAAASGERFVRGGMATSFRSTATVLDFVDRVFASEEARKGLVFGGSAVMHQAFRADQPGMVELWPLLEPLEEAQKPRWDDPVDSIPPDDPRTRLADEIARTIKGWIGREKLKARGRMIRAGDIMILVRGRGPLFFAIIKKLKQIGVPVAGEDRLSLPAQLAVRDVLALARFCLFPEDDLTLATVLRSPFCDVSEEDLFDLAHHRRGALWYALNARREDKPSFADALTFLEEMVRRADFLRPYELLAHALGPAGGRARLIARLGKEAEDPLDELLGQSLAFETSGAPTLQAFVDFITQREADIKREHEQGRDEVRVMTAHGAKGLEAPVVILPDTTGAPGGNHTVRLLDPKREGCPPIWAGKKGDDPIALQDLRARHADREAEEHRRLLYVALTRAEDRLLICGARGKTKLPEGCWYSLCEQTIAQVGESHESPLLDLAGRPRNGWRIEGKGSETRPDRHETGAGRADPGSPDWLLAKPARELAPSDLTPSHLGGAHGQSEYLGQSEYSGASLPPERAKRRGTLIHLLLEVLAPHAVEKREAVAEALLGINANDWSPRDRAAMLAEALGVLMMPEAARIFGPGSRAEVPVGGLLADLGPGEVHGFIDRLVVEKSRVLIVDFKTGVIPDGRPEAYLRQLAVYARVLGKLYPERAVDAALLWTAAPRLDIIATEELEAAYARAAHEIGAS
ncbi:MAG: double-strand break repair helicase AddA [Neomegalonema sp.]|nr:double-strand break repair helicase AddA [Neomegalonema sp.]